MATLITVTSFNKLNNTDEAGTTAAPIIINANKIVSVKTRATAYRTTGVSEIVYELPVNQKSYQVTLIVTEAASAIVTAANA